MTTTRIYLYPVWLRIWHAINALVFIVLVVTGISLHYAGPESGFIRFDIAVALHNAAAVILTIGYGIYVAGNLISGNGMYYRGIREDMGRNLVRQAMFYVSGIFKNEPHPFAINKERKFNPLQKISYVVVMYLCMPLIIITGLGLLFPETVVMNIFGISGLALTAYGHQVIGFVLSIFLLVHLYTCTLGDKPGTLFRSMINGYHEEHDPGSEQQDEPASLQTD
jgi:thiosulfate reductase cytochrome b subunit